MANQTRGADVTVEVRNGEVTITDHRELERLRARVAELEAQLAEIANEREQRLTRLAKSIVSGTFNEPEYCSECGEEITECVCHRYCPQCGAFDCKIHSQKGNE